MPGADDGDGWGIPGRMQWDGMRVHEATQNGAQSKTHELFISGIFH